MMEQHIRLAQTLPPRLLSFFARFPPAPIASLSSTTPSTASNTSPSDPNAFLPATSPPSQTRLHTHTKPSPFAAFRNPTTQNWHAPHISLRRQAGLFKLAAQHNVLSLMPSSPKHPEEKERKRIENGLRVQGTGVGKRVKGKLWERTLKGRLEGRRKAMEGMPALVREWKERGHGRGWKKWPK
ncbi:hypothetical protein B0A48_05795 [Cryoendolithus antarcticus]|uniref:Large ribosomal subunit protein mL59 domain-containing protein n=1 Tax=Cryoendolithus antarcticus TaxID=1507870 RepID=A0A1V8TC07_9PEZI|nr:hypothetical protein B0A48_05795 [Cryoendolithus antarcticus]